MGKGSFISPEQRAGVRSRVEPLALAMARAGFTPDLLTLIGFGVAALGGMLAALGIWLLAGIVATAGAAFDMFDGAVARATGTTSPFGAFMDSTFDRWGEGVVYLGIVVGSTLAGFDVGAWLGASALVSAFMVSYVRARGEALGFSSGTGIAAVGFAPREVRTVILAVGLVGAGLLGEVSGSGGAGSLLLAGSLGLITVLATVTVVQRILYVRAQSRRPGS
jgi:CDP-diacylglycerol--glycerol-3-phosphate 3-phosphatidyltransferase